MSNRSSGRRRRGGRPTSNRGPSDGNRQTHRNSGNAHQLLDKYKNLARDAHQQGDRVMNEYYLQFADHYFRVLAEVNDRKDEQKREREESKAKHQDKQKDEPQDKAAKSSSSKGGGKKDEDKKPAPKRSSSSRKADGEDKNGETLKISADALPGAVPIEAGDEEVNGKSTAGKSSSSRSRGKPSDGEGAAAEA